MSDRSPRRSPGPREDRPARSGGPSHGRSYQHTDRAPPTDQRDRPYRNFRDNPESHRPQIRLQHEESEIKLDEQQAARIRGLDDQIKALGSPKEPSRTDQDKRLQDIEDEVRRLYGQRDDLQNKIDECQKELNDFRQSRDESGSQSITAEFREAQRDRERIENELRAIQESRGQKVDQLKDSKTRLGVKNQDEAFSRLEELDEQIETQTLSNSQLKKLLSERDRLLSISKSLEGFTKLQEDVEAIRAQERDKRTELEAAKARFTKARDARNAAQGPKDQPSPSQRITATIREHREQMDTLWMAIRAKNQERKTAKVEFDKAWEDYRGLSQQVKALTHERLVILKEAEKAMILVEEGRKRIGEIREFVNPHEVEINAGIALIAYLEGFIEKQSEKLEARAPQPKVAGSDDLALLAALRKPTKKEKETAKKGQQVQKPVTLSLDMATLGQFEKVGLRAPLNVDQIPALLEQLNAKVKAWKDEFRAAKVTFNVQADGKVTVAITIR